HNLKLFLQNQEKLGLVGLVTMKTVPGGFPYATMLLAAWLKGKTPGRGAQPIEGAFADAMVPIGVNLDDQFGIYVLRQPLDAFIGFTVDKALPPGLAGRLRPWHANVDEIGGVPVSIGWGSGNLNSRWFAGSPVIPEGDACNGKYWRALIVDGLHRAALTA